MKLKEGGPVSIRIKWIRSVRTSERYPLKTRIPQAAETRWGKTAGMPSENKLLHGLCQCQTNKVADIKKSYKQLKKAELKDETASGPDHGGTKTALNSRAIEVVTYYCYLFLSVSLVCFLPGWAGLLPGSLLFQVLSYLHTWSSSPANPPRLPTALKAWSTFQSSPVPT